MLSPVSTGMGDCVWVQLLGRNFIIGWKSLSLLSMQHGLLATYPAPIWTIFETADINRFPRAYTGEKFSNFRIEVFPGRKPPLPSNRHNRSNGDCLEGKRENYQVCSVQYCVQQLCTVQCTHI